MHIVKSAGELSRSIGLTQCSYFEQEQVGPLAVLLWARENVVKHW